MPGDNEHKLEPLQRPRDSPSAGVMLVLGSFVDDKLRCGIKKQFYISVQVVFLHEPPPLWIRGDRIFRLL